MSKELDEQAEARLREAKSKEEFDKIMADLQGEGYIIKSRPPDPMAEIMQQLTKRAPKLLDDFFNREKRITITMKLTAEEAMRLTEFMVKDGMGKTQVMEEP